MAVKKTKALFIPVLVGALVGIMINLLLLPKSGVMIASISVTISYIVIWVQRLVNASKQMDLQINYIRDLFSYFLILIQAITILYLDHSKFSFYALMCFMLLLMINYDTINWVSFSIRQKIR